MTSEIVNFFCYHYNTVRRSCQSKLSVQKNRRAKMSSEKGLLHLINH